MKRSNMESLNCSKGNTVGIVVAYFLIYVVWGSTYFFIGVALKDFSPFGSSSNLVVSFSPLI